MKKKLEDLSFNAAEKRLLKLIDESPQGKEMRQIYKYLNEWHEISYDIAKKLLKEANRSRTWPKI